jgi:hypothetical protein
MRAAVTEAFGGIDRTVVRDVAKPTPGPGGVLHARGKIVVRP